MRKRDEFVQIILRASLGVEGLEIYEYILEAFLNLSGASAFGRLDVVSLLTDRGLVEMDAQLLLTSAYGGQLVMVKYWLHQAKIREATWDLDPSGPIMERLFYSACFSRNLDVIQFVIDLGVDIFCLEGRAIRSTLRFYDSFDNNDNGELIAFFEEKARSLNRLETFHELIQISGR